MRFGSGVAAREQGPVNPAARHELLGTLEDHWRERTNAEDTDHLPACPTSDQPAVREVFDALLVNVTDEPWSFATREDDERYREDSV